MQGGPYVDAYLMWPTQPAAATAVEAAAASLRAAAVAEGAVRAASTGAGGPQAQEQGHTQEQEQQQKQERGRDQKQGQGHTQPQPLLQLPADLPTYSLWGARRRQEWQLCFSTVPVKLTGRRWVWLDGRRVVVPDNAEQLLAGERGFGKEQLLLAR